MRAPRPERDWHPCRVRCPLRSDVRGRCTRVNAPRFKSVLGIALQMLGRCHGHITPRTPPHNEPARVNRTEEQHGPRYKNACQARALALPQLPPTGSETPDRRRPGPVAESHSACSMHLSHERATYSPAQARDRAERDRRHACEAQRTGGPYSRLSAHRIPGVSRVPLRAPVPSRLRHPCTPARSAPPRRASRAQDVALK